MEVVSAVRFRIDRASKQRAVTQVFSFMERESSGKCSMCPRKIKPNEKRGTNHSTGAEFCCNCWPVRG